MYKERGNAHWSAATAQMSKLPKYFSLLTPSAVLEGAHSQAKCRCADRLIFSAKNN